MQKGGGVAQPGNQLYELDDEELYADLDVSPDRQKIRLLEEQCRKLENENSSLKQENKDLRERWKVLEESKLTLEKNISQLYNTAKAQIARLQDQIKGLQQQQ